MTLKKNHLQFITMLDEVKFLVHVLPQRKLSLEDINRLWLKDYRSYGQKIDYWKFKRICDFIVEGSGIEVQSEHRYNQGDLYWIDPKELPRKGKLFGWSLSAFSIGEVLLRCKKLRKRIIMPSFPSGMEHFETVVKAMYANKVILVVYKKYGADDYNTFSIEPYFTKAFENRIYLIGRVESGKLLTLPLDRILEIKPTGQKFKFDETITAEDHFKYAYGVVVNDKKWPARRVVIRAYADEPYYLQDVKMHKSQVLIRHTLEYSDFQYKIGITSDLIGRLIHKGDRVKVLEPKELVEEIKKRLHSTLDRYDN